MNPIRVSNLGKRYRAYSGPMERLKEVIFPGRRRNSREFIALEDVSFEIPCGCALGVIGPNGAGKSTLLKILAGIIEPTTGKATLEGKLASIIELGAGFHPEFTGRDNIFLNAAIHGQPREHAEASFDSIARFSELGAYLDMPVKTYSSGMFVRLAFAAAIQAQPDILLVDEALAVGDAVFAHRCLARIREMRDKGVTILFVSHDTNTIAGLCDRAIFLDRGRLAADGPPKDVIHLYLLNVAERLSSLNEKGDRAAAFHEIGAVQSAEETAERRFGTFQARITDIFLEDQSGTQMKKFVSGRPTRFRIIVRVDEKLENPVLGVMIRNRFGVEIFGTNTHLQRETTGAYEPGSALEGIFEFPMLLGAGIYTASFAVHTADGHFFDYRVDARVFEVIGAHETIGMISLPTTISVQKVSSALASADDAIEKAYADAPDHLTVGDDAEHYLAGDWYAAQESDGVTCRWMGHEATAFLRVPEKRKTLNLRLRTYYPEVAQNPIAIECFLDNMAVGKISISEYGWQDIKLEIPGSPHPRVVQLRLRADRVWIPREYSRDSTDTRELSVLISNVETA